MKNTASQALATRSTNNKPDLVDVRRDPENYPRVNRVELPVLLKAINQAVIMAASYIGRPVDAPTADAIATSLAELILNDEDGIGTKYLSLYEVVYCTRKWALGDEEIYGGVSVRALWLAIKRYCLTEGHDADKAARYLDAKLATIGELALQARQAAAAAQLAEKYNTNKKE